MVSTTIAVPNGIDSHNMEWMMLYVISAYETPEDFEARSNESKHSYWGAWKAYAEALTEAGVKVGGRGLMAPSTATTVRLREGERFVQDGPYADTKEQLGGFCLIEVPDLDAALDWAARCPAAATGVVEVRPALPSCDPAAMERNAAEPSLAAAH
ncbi:YCII-related domain protein [Aquisphaera giovannonii]|uniref:YCII-related domain protein n=1 Tax=Aquisphaera giovannonii TaxID=406548 RepID=A0A5B9W8S8_9BACT|nr:YciI family protein [Aquisphaera giovannonii]QEH36797.1 YCII-related domain protein [Aquisphaera giovannonii]